MTRQEAIKILKAKLACMEREVRGTDEDCNKRNCLNCDLCYKQGTTGEQMEVLQMAIDVLDKDTNVVSKSDDPISRQAAIDAVHKDYDTILDFKSDGRTVAGSFEDIINALPPAQPEPCEDCVSRKAVIRLLHSGYHSKSMIEEVKELPSTQPENVRCRDCKWYELPSHKITENCVRWMKSNGILLPIKPNDYCSYAERRTDEPEK